MRLSDSQRPGPHSSIFCSLRGREKSHTRCDQAAYGSIRPQRRYERTEGVWIGVVEEIAERLRELVKEIAIVVVEQHLDLALDVADYAYVLDRGRLALEDRSSAVRNDPQLLQLPAPGRVLASATLRQLTVAAPELRRAAPHRTLENGALRQVGRHPQP